MTPSKKAQITRAEKRRQRCQAAYDKTKSHVWLARLRDATTAALKASVAR